MKYKFLITIIAAVLVLYTSGCSKKADAPLVTHKGIVLYNICGNIVIQTLGPDFYGEDNWVDENNTSKPTYNHVFTVSNACNFGIHASGDTIVYAFIQPKTQTCAQCLLYVATPATKYNIQVVK